MAQAKLKDIALWRWRFYLRRHGYDPSNTQEQHWENFKTLRDAAVSWAGGGKEAFREYNEDPDSLQTNVRLAGVPWPESREPGAMLRTLDVRAMLDVFYVESGCARRGAAVPEDFTLLMRDQWRTDGGKASFLGQAACLAAEFERIQRGEAQILAQAMLEQWHEDASRQVELIELDFGFVAVPAGAEDEVCALLIQSNPDSLRQAETFVHVILPQLFTARLKAPLTMRKLRRGLLPAAHEIEKELVGELERIPHQPRRLKALEQTSYSLSYWQAELGDKISQCEVELATLRVNAENVGRLLEDKLLASQKTALDGLLAAPLRLQVEQVEADLRYLSITETRAERMRQGIGAMAGVRSAHWQRAITILFGVFIWFGASQMFPEILSWPKKWRLVGLLGTAIVFYGIDWLLSRRQESTGRRPVPPDSTTKAKLTDGGPARPSLPATEESPAALPGSKNRELTKRA